VTGEKGIKAEENARLLSDLYDLRSKIVHGADATKERGKLEPRLPALGRIAREIRTNYVLFLSENSRAGAWRIHWFVCMRRLLRQLTDCALDPGEVFWRARGRRHKKQFRRNARMGTTNPRRCFTRWVEFAVRRG